jgi:hypothetical protein
MYQLLSPLFLLLALAACAPARTGSGDAQPLTGWLSAQGIRVVSRAAWSARPPVLPTKAHVPQRITIHHTATALNHNRTLEEKLRGLQAFSQRDDSLADGRRKPAWADVPYHFYVAADGRVGEGREWRWVGDSNTPYDPAGHLLVVIEGNFEREQLTDAQRATLDRLIPALARRFSVPGSLLGAHRDFARTSCPGTNVMSELPRWRSMLTR